MRTKWFGVAVSLLLFTATVPAWAQVRTSFVRQWGGPWNGSGSGDGLFKGTHALGVSPLLRVYVADEAAHRIQYFSMDGLFLGKWGQWGSGTNDINDPVCLAFQASGMVYVVERDNNRIHYFSPDGLHRGMWGTPGSGDGQFNQPAAAAFAPDGSLFVTDRLNHRVQHFSATGIYLGQFGTTGTNAAQFREPFGIAISPGGRIYVADSQNCRIQVFGTNGTYQFQWGSPGSGNGQFGNTSIYNNGPGHISQDSRGYLYIADPNNSRIEIFDESGLFIGKWGAYGTGSGGYYFPNGASPAPGWQIYIADEGNSLIQQQAVFVGNQTNLHFVSSRTTPASRVMQVEATPDLVYTLQRSTNLVQWADAQIFSGAAGLFTLTDAINQAATFYRVK